MFKSTGEEHSRMSGSCRSAGKVWETLWLSIDCAEEQSQTSSVDKGVTSSALNIPFANSELFSTSIMTSNSQEQAAR